jgi:hypothetical protein
MEWKVYKLREDGKRVLVGTYPSRRLAAESLPLKTVGGIQRLQKECCYTYKG